MELKNFEYPPSGLGASVILLQTSYITRTTISLCAKINVTFNSKALKSRTPRPFPFVSIRPYLAVAGRRRRHWSRVLKECWRNFITRADHVRAIFFIRPIYRRHYQTERIFNTLTRGAKFWCGRNCITIITLPTYHFRFSSGCKKIYGRSVLYPIRNRNINDSDVFQYKAHLDEDYGASQWPCFGPTSMAGSAVRCGLQTM